MGVVFLNSWIPKWQDLAPTGPTGYSCIGNLPLIWQASRIRCLLVRNMDVFFIHCPVSRYITFSVSNYVNVSVFSQLILIIWCLFIYTYIVFRSGKLWIHTRSCDGLVKSTNNESCVPDQAVSSSYFESMCNLLEAKCAHVPKLLRADFLFWRFRSNISNIIQSFTNKQLNKYKSNLQNVWRIFVGDHFCLHHFFHLKKKNTTPSLGTPHPQKKGRERLQHRIVCFKKISITGAIEEITSKKKRVAWWRGWLMWGESVDYDYCKYIYTYFTICIYIYIFRNIYIYIHFTIYVFDFTGLYRTLQDYIRLF